MLKKVTIKSVGIKETKTVDGVEVKYVYSKGKNEGKNFVRVSIQTEETGDLYWANNAFVDSKATKLKVGDVELLDLVERQDGDNTWRDFNFPTKEQLADYAKSL